MDLYSQTAPFLSEDPEEQKQALQPPHKFWRALWESIKDKPILAPPTSTYVRSGPVIWIEHHRKVVVGPICQSAEWAEQKAAEAFNKTEGRELCRYIIIRTDEEGRPL